jgi:hypothetical protein
MGQTVQADHLAFEIESVSGMISGGLPVSWWEYFLLLFPPFGVLSCTLAALLLPPILFWAVKRYWKMQDESRTPFPFMELPQELRDMIYEDLIEDLIEHPAYPPRPTCPQHTKTMTWMLPGRWQSTSLASQQQKRGNSLFLASKQIYKEYMDLLCKRATFHLTVSPQNCQNPNSTTISTSPSNARIWKIAPSTLKQLRSCDLELITTSSMLGATDPRNMVSSDWTLARQIRQELTSLTNVTSFTLDAKALGDPLWNPLWIWYHACQSFKSMGTSQSDTTPVGPQLNKITFSLDTWSPGENYMARDIENKGQWTWYCLKGHGVGVDCGADITIREFCGQLYQVCRVCRPELDSEDEDDA